MFTNYLRVMKALTFSTFGGPEVLQYTNVPEPVLKQDELFVK
jgi:NADPH:quinone reductase